MSTLPAPCPARRRAALPLGFLAALLLAAPLLATGAAWGVGFAAFNHDARRRLPPPPEADGIVALTGGAGRVDAALLLLVQNRAPRLLVSGVGRGTDLADLARAVPLTPGQAAEVTLGRAATTTLGNAAETAAWARAAGARSLIVVTAGYHMRRALIEIGRALPGVALYPVPVQPPALRRGMEFTTVRMMANEYDKYLLVRLGLAGPLAGHPVPTLAPTSAPTPGAAP